MQPLALKILRNVNDLGCRLVSVALGTTLALQVATARGRIAKPSTGRETGRASDMGEGAMPTHRQVLAGVLVILIGIAFESSRVRTIRAHA